MGTEFPGHSRHLVSLDNLSFHLLKWSLGVNHWYFASHPGHPLSPKWVKVKEIYSRSQEPCHTLELVFCFGIFFKHLMKPGPAFWPTLLLVSKLPHIYCFSVDLCFCWFLRRTLFSPNSFKGKPYSEKELYSDCLWRRRMEAQESRLEIERWRLDASKSCGWVWGWVGRSLADGRLQGIGGLG